MCRVRADAAGLSGGLQCVQLGVQAAQAHQFLVAAVFGDPAALEDVDPVGVPDAGEPVGDQQDRAVVGACASPDLFEQVVFGAGVQCGGGFVADQQGSVPEEAACRRESLPLAAGEFLAAVEPSVQQGVETVRQGRDDLVGSGVAAACSTASRTPGVVRSSPMAMLSAAFIGQCV